MLRYCLAFAVLAMPVRAEVAYQWVQLLPDGQAGVRVITDEACDQVASTVPLAPRGTDVLGDVSLHVCEAVVDRASVASVTVAGTDMAVPQEAPARVAVIGDTGCRVEGHHSDQRCQTPDWIFDAVAGAVAQAGPDLIVHVGDFVYQWNCYNGTEGCGANHQLREWTYWEADFFSKAKGLLPSVPWAFVRGNHEDCMRADRGWRGWTLFFSAGPVEGDQGACASDQASHLSFLISLPGGAAPALDLLMYDSADEDAFQASDFALAEGIGHEVWLLTHVPLWSSHQIYYGTLPGSVDMVLSGHEHLFELVQYQSGNAVQVVEGASGTKLEDTRRRSWTVFETNSRDFSFVMIERQAGAPTWLTLCAVSPSGVVARNSWSVDDARVVTAGSARAQACGG